MYKMCNTCPERFSVDILDPNKVIMLPYYRDINSYLPSPVARSNYTPYHLFCLKKNIMTLIRQFDKRYDVSFPSMKYKDSMVITMQLYDSGFPISPDNETYRLITENLQYYVDIYPYCLLHRREYLEARYNREWLHSIYPYVASTVGIHNDGNIFVNLENSPNYTREWEQLYSKVEKTIDDYYHSGTVYRPSEDLIANWNLERLDNDLYIANWDYKFTHDKTEFLYSKNKRIALHLGDTKRVNVKDGWLTLTVESYNEVADLIEHIL